MITGFIHAVDFPCFCNGNLCEDWPGHFVNQDAKHDDGSNGRAYSGRSCLTKTDKPMEIPPWEQCRPRYFVTFGCALTISLPCRSPDHLACSPSEDIKHAHDSYLHQDTQIQAGSCEGKEQHVYGSGKIIY